MASDTPKLADLEPLEPQRAAAAATRLLNDEAFLEACRRYEDRLARQWRATGIEDLQRREDLYYQTRALQNVLIELNNLEAAMHSPEKF